METTAQGNGWNIKDLLADLMGTTAELEPEPRAEIWASDLGKPYVDRWLQMMGIPYSNPLTGKTLMTFFLGKQIEVGVEQMLIRCGVGCRSQERLVVQQPDCLPVVGRPDLVVQVANWETLTAVEDAQWEDSPRDRMALVAQKQALKALLSGWRERYPEGLPTTVFEVKSLNSYAFKYHRGEEGLSNAYPHHRLQLYTYMRGLGLTEGHLVYVARDTGWMEEVVVRETEQLEKAWIQDIEMMSYYYLSEKRPPLEPAQVDGKDNWRVSYSRYKDYLLNPQEVPSGAFTF
ncbi:MAG: hypothetical protein ACYCZF_12040 [Anaerolineae bacterium]